jgi:hypothetical protein
LLHFKNKKNVFVTGIPGSGKTKFVKAATKHCKRNNLTYCVLTKTHAQKINVGNDVAAQTVNGFARIGIPTNAADFHPSRYPNLSKNWNLADVLILEEISMWTADFLDWLNKAAKMYRNNDKFMGGIQIVAGGDFAQMPCPPGKTALHDLPKYLQRHIKVAGKHQDPAMMLYDIKELQAYAFQSSFWHEAKFEYVLLKNNYRHKSKMLRSALHDLRLGLGGSDAVNELVEYCKQPFDKREGFVKLEIDPVVQCGTKRKANDINQLNLTKLKPSNPEIHVHVAVDSLVVNEEHVPPLKIDEARHSLSQNQFFHSRARVPKELELCVGAAVILAKPFDDDLVTGSQGVIEKYILHPMIHQMDNKSVLQPATEGDLRMFKDCSDFKDLSSIPRLLSTAEGGGCLESGSFQS